MQTRTDMANRLWMATPKEGERKSVTLCVRNCTEPGHQAKSERVSERELSAQQCTPS